MSIEFLGLPLKNLAGKTPEEAECRQAERGSQSSLTLRSEELTSLDDCGSEPRHFGQICRRRLCDDIDFIPGSDSDSSMARQRRRRQDPSANLGRARSEHADLGLRRAPLCETNLPDVKSFFRL